MIKVNSREIDQVESEGANEIRTVKEEIQQKLELHNKLQIAAVIQQLNRVENRTNI